MKRKIIRGPGIKGKPKHIKNIYRRKVPPSLAEIEFSPSALKKLSSPHLDLFIVLSMAYNESNALLRLYTISTFQHNPDKFQDLYAESQRFTLLKLYAGKTFETWEVIRSRYFGTSAARSLGAKLDKQELAALEFLKRYFGRSRNLLYIIRNEFAFHYTRASLEHAKKYLSRKKGRTIYLDAKHYWNDLYLAGEFAFHAHYYQRLGLDPTALPMAMHAEVAEVAGQLSVLVRGLLGALLDEIADASGSKTVVSLITVRGRPKLDDANLPALVDLGDDLTGVLDERFLDVRDSFLPEPVVALKRSTSRKATKRRRPTQNARALRHSSR